MNQHLGLVNELLEWLYPFTCQLANFNKGLMLLVKRKEKKREKQRENTIH